MKKAFIILSVILLSAVSVVAETEEGGNAHDYAPVPFPDEEYTDELRVSRGGQLYDDWWRTKVDVDKPEGDHPLWKEQSSNMRQGYATYRCKECHGWDYKGKEGAYRTGSHYTGFKGIYAASKNMTVFELQEVLRGAVDKRHDFSKYLNDGDIYDLSLFIRRGIIDMAGFVNSYGAHIGGNESRGGRFFMNNCMLECHGRTGQMINFGDEDEPEFVSTIAKKNPWEFIHKVRAGQPGTRMPSGIALGWSDDVVRDLLAYARILSEDLPEPGWLARLIGNIGSEDDKSRKARWVRAEETRGFGPVLDR